MALRWIEGFDAATIDDGMYQRLYDAAASTLNANFTQDDGANFPGDEAVSQDENILVTNALVSPANNTWIVSFAFRADDNIEINDGAIPYVALNNTDGEQIRVEFLDDVVTDSRPGATAFYRLRIMRGVTEIATSIERFNLGAFSNAEFVYFQFKITIDNAAGVVEGRYTWMNKPTRNPAAGYTTLTWDAAVSSVDTQNQTSTGADRVAISFNSGNTSDNVTFDDIIIMDSTGTKNNDFPGKVAVTRQLTDTAGGGDGDTTSWTLATATSTEDALYEPGHTLIDDDKRLTSDTIGQIHLMQMDALQTEVNGSPIIGCRVDLHGKMETSGSLSIGFMWRKTTATAAQIEFGTALTVSSTTPVAASVIAEDDPNTLTDWVQADMDVMQIGVKNNG